MSRKQSEEFKDLATCAGPHQSILPLCRLPHNPCVGQFSGEPSHKPLSENVQLCTVMYSSPR